MDSLFSSDISIVGTFDKDITAKTKLCRKVGIETMATMGIIWHKHLNAGTCMAVGIRHPVSLDLSQKCQFIKIFAALFETHANSWAND